MQEMIPQFQREVVQVIPELSQIAAGRIAENHTGALTRSETSRGQVQGVFWRTIVDPVGGASEATRGTLPAVDPLGDEVIDQVLDPGLVRRHGASSS